MRYREALALSIVLPIVAVWYVVLVLAIAVLSPIGLLFRRRTPF